MLYLIHMAVFTCKTYFDCVNHAADLAGKLAGDLTCPAIIFCEDKLTLSVEEAVTKRAGGSFSVEVSSFGRYVSKRLPSRNTLSKEGTAMAVKKILSSLAPSLTALKKVCSSPSLASETGELIAQLKSAKISPDELLSATDGLDGRSAEKIRDIAKIFAAYEKFLSENNLTDSNNALSDMLKAIDNDEAMPKTKVIFLGLSSLTRQSAEVVRKLVKTAISTDFFVVKGDNAELYVNEFYEFVKQYDPAPKALPSTLTEEGEAILNGLYDPRIFAKEGKPTQKIFFYEAADATDEAEYIARRIKRAVIENGIRYGDVAIAVGDPETYLLRLTRKLSDYDIPFFSDEKRTLSSLPVARLTDSLLKAAARRDFGEVKRVIGNCLFIPDKKISDRIIRRLILGTSTYKSFIAGKFEESEIYEVSKLSLLIAYLTKLGKKAAAKDYADLIRGFLDDCGLKANEKAAGEKLEKYGATDEYALLAAENEKMSAILDEIESVLADEPLTTDEFRRILAAGEQACEVSVIPQRKDCVYIGELKNCRFNQYEILFAAGLTSDVPRIKGDAALLLDSDIADLEKLSLSIEPKIRVVNDREREASGIALGSFKRELNLSRPALSPAGTPTAKSRITEYITQIFSGKDKPFKSFSRSSLEKRKFTLNDERRDSVDAFDFLALRPAMFSLVKIGGDYRRGGAFADLKTLSSFYGALKQNGNERALTASDLLLGRVNRDPVVRRNIPVSNYFPDGKVSASVLECFYACPYKCFMRYGAGATEAATGEARSLDYGNVLHEVAEKLVAEISAIDDEQALTEFSKKTVENILSADVYRRFATRPDLAYSLKLLEDEAEKLCRKIYEELKNSDFKSIGQEVRFDDYSAIKSFPLKTMRRGFRLYGKADRVDKYGDYIRIIDYKTGHADEKIKDKNFYTGRNMQLYLYMNAFARGDNKPAGAYYYALDDNFVSADKSKVSMYGKTLKSEAIVKATDKNFYENGKSAVIGGTVKSGGKLNGTAFADEKTLRSYMRYAEILAEKAVDDVCDGVIAPSPYDGTCEYCEFGASCRYDSDADRKPREVSDRITSTTITEAVDREISTKRDEITEEKRNG